MEKPILIYDTDMDTDCDDAGAIAMLLQAHLAGKIELIGVAADSVSPYAAPCCEVLTRYYGVDVPIGTIYADDYQDSEENIARFAEYRGHSRGCIDRRMAYNLTFAEEIGKKDREYMSAAQLYRTVLSQARDHSVTVLCVGMLTAVAEALVSKADEISPLSGVELFAQKVKNVVTMGNPDKMPDFNWGMDAVGAEQFFALCPVPVYISADGESIITGEVLSSVMPAGHPVRRAYEQWLGGEHKGRSSWDLIATLYAMDPDTPYLTCKERGNCTYDAGTKKLMTQEVPNAQCHTLHVACTEEKMAQVLTAYMLGAE